jgi:Phosphoglycerate dehydrogenase and related dehydrogenases
MRKVILTKKLSRESVKLFEDIPDIELITVLDGAQASFDLHIRDAEAILLSTAYKMTREVIQSAENLKVISRTGVGVDNVDVSAATEQGILVLNTPLANSISVAEHAVALIAGISKQLIMYDGALRNGDFKIRRTNRCTDINGKTLGLIGCGRIGRIAAEKCKAAFNMQVIGYDPYIRESEGITLYSGIEEVFKRADYISLHIPLTDETRNMVGERLLSLMKPTAYLINTSRGGIIDERMLAKALESGRIAGAALDVLELEPPQADNPLFPLKNVILTPHSAALTNECSERIAHEAALGISDYLKGQTPRFVFNRDLVKS